MEKSELRKAVNEATEKFISRNRKICWEAEMERDEYCVGENKIRQFVENLIKDYLR